ncbi:MAG: hypothetical protein KFF68_12105 [Desulfosarcina sp.]|nr:hypothetical protein [Desulfosarcina sp.]
MFWDGGHADGIRGRAENAAEIILSCFIVAKSDTEGKPALSDKHGKGRLF